MKRIQSRSEYWRHYFSRISGSKSPPMTKSLVSMLPDAASVLTLEPEELGGVLLEYFNSMTAQEQFNLNRHNFLMSPEVRCYGRDADGKLECAFAEAWAWLERECLITLKPNAGGSYSYFITRRGRKLIDRDAYEGYRRAAMLPRAMLDPRIESRVYPSFLRGAYDTAVFEALREVEVAVREAADFGPEKYGEVMMREAFNPANGPLTDRTALKSEQEAMANLFAGAIGLYKNSSSHRTGTVRDPAIAVEVIVLANRLLGLVGERRQSTSKTPGNE
jgi:uncharacterized protein (TIGR02391 family)